MYLNNDKKWATIKMRVAEGIKKLFPIEGKTGKIELVNVEIPDSVGAGISDQKDKLLGRGSLATPVYAYLKLTRNKGKSETCRVKILDLPILTSRGTFIVQGKDYSVFNQVRLLPGVYVRKPESSNEVYSDFNLGKGLGFEIHLDTKGVFTIKFDKSALSSSGSKTPLYPLIIALGGTDGMIAQYWGDEVLKINKNASNTEANLETILSRVVYPTKRTGDTVKDLKDYFATNVLSAKTTKITLGSEHDKVTPEVILKATKKLVSVYKGDEEEDDLDSLLFKEVLGVEDHLMLRIEKKAREEGLIYKVQAKIDQGAPLKAIILPNFLTKLIEGFFTKSSLSAPQTEINPIEILETSHKITAMGEGGIANERAIPMSARNLHPSHFGYLDPVRTTESTRVGIDLRTTINSEVKDRNIYTPFIDRSGKQVMLRPMDLVGKVIAFPNQNGMPKVRALVGNEMKEVPRSKVDYWMPKASNMFTVTTNLVPFLHNDQGNRITMAGRMVTQAVPLVHREAPLVQIKDQSGQYATIQERYGKEFFVPRAPEDGVVTEVTTKFIKVNNKKVDIYDNFPLNLKCPSGKMLVNVLHPDGNLWRGKVEDYSFTKGDKIQSVNLKTGKSAWYAINAFDYQDNDKKLLRIKFRSGRTVIVTEDHSLITINNEGELVPIFPKDCIPLETKCPVAMLPSFNAITDKYDSYYYGVVGGLYLSEGWTRGNQVFIASQDSMCKKEIAFALKQVTPNVIHQRESKVVVTDEDLRKWIDVSFGHYAHQKFIASKLFGYSDEFKKGLLAGYMAGDGTVGVHDKIPKKSTSHFVVSASTSSERLRNDLVDMFASLNVFTTINKKNLAEKNANWKDAFIVTIPVREIPTWDLFYYKNKQVLLEKQVANLPYSASNRFMLTKRQLAHLPEEAVKKYTKGSDLRWDTIKSITPAPHEKYVYDFEVAKSNMFAVQGGLIIHNTFLTMYPTVKVGDKVKKGDVLADSNFTKNGELAIGTNLNVAYTPYKGWTHEDSIVISESTAKKLTSQHMYIKEFEISAGESFIDKASFIKWFPTKITAENIKKLDEQGVVRVGEMVQRGDILVTGLKRKTATAADAMLKRLRGNLVNPYKDASETWDHDTPGKVVDVVKQNRLIRVVCTTEDQAKRGDKLSGMHGNKGTIGLILPDNEMPVDKNGNPVDALFNPASVPSRVNPGQMYEAMEGKRARMTGRSKVIIDNFDPADSSEKVLDKLKKEGVPVEEPLYDPITKKKLGDVFIGTPYVMKLHKQTEGNFSALYRGAYDVNNQPIKGGEEGSKGVGMLDVYALLGHNARANLAEMATFKSDRNDDFWNRLESGLTPLPAKEPFAFKKFKSLINASGMHVTEESNGDLGIAPMDDKTILRMSNGAIQSGAILENHMGVDRPEKGGIFDPKITGGLKGAGWSHVNLAEPIVNPMFESVVEILLHKSIVGMNPKDVKKELAAINVSKRIGEVDAAIKVATGSDRNKLIKELKYLTAIKKAGRKPEDYVLTKFPIIPPQFRPVYDSQTGGAPMVSDVNYLYKDLLNVNEKLQRMKDYPDSEKEVLLKDLRQSAHAIVGLMAPVNKANEKRGVSGFMKQLTGSDYNGVGTSKESFFHKKILKRQQTLTGRGTILPDPTLNVDNVKLPWEMCWTIYQPFIISAFQKRGINIIKAREEVKNRTETAKQILLQEMSKRPVLLNRAPTLHKYNIMAFKPIPTEGKSILTPPLILKGYAADYDGDSVAGDTKVLVQNSEGKVEIKEIKNV